MPNIVPISDPNRGFRTWYIDEVYTGTGEGKFVPNKDDLVLSWVDGWMRVVMVDYTTGESTLQPYTPPRADEDSNIGDLVSIGPGNPLESYRIYIDTSVIPHTMAFDARLKVYGTDVMSMKLFRGTRLETAPVVSRFYDNQGQLLGENIPMEVIHGENGPMTAVKKPIVAHISLALPDGEPLTAVFYDTVGNVVSVSSLLVRNTQWIRQLDASTKYVTSIEMISPFLSDADSRVLECPINIPMAAIAKQGRVHYSDGSSRTLPIDGNKFRVFGLERFVSTILGQKQPVSLIYYLSDDEMAYGSVNGDTQHLSEDYLATTVKVEGAYSVKLFTYPVWIDAINGYRFEHFLHNLDRDETYRVTDKVTLSENSQTFDPLAYGVSQDLTFRLPLAEVSNQFKDYVHVQTTRIALLRPGTDTATKWTVTYDLTKPSYGTDLEAETEFGNGVQWKLRIDNDKGSREHWLRDIYEPILPLYDSTSESEAPTPNYFRLIVADEEFEVPISMWEHEFAINTQLKAGDSVFIQFMRRTDETDWELATAALAVRVVYTP